MPDGLRRYQQSQDTHFITFSCYHSRPYLAPAGAKHTFLKILEQTRARHGARIYAYVLMPTHVHLLLSERFAIPLDQFLKAVKQQTSKVLKGELDHFWQKRYYDFNVQTEDKFVEKMKYIHRNPVVDGLAEAPELYPWSSFHHYATGEPGLVEVESQWLASRRERALQSHSSR